jgi:hypothetical protein
LNSGKTVKGNRESSEKFMESDSDNVNKSSRGTKNKRENTTELTKVVNTSSNKLEKSRNEGSLPRIPDILSPNPDIHNLIGIESVARASDRLSLLGGVQGLLSRMRRDDVKPDIKTFSMLVDCIESNVESEERLLVEMRKSGVDMDTPFCNLLMRKRVFRQDVEGAKVSMNEVFTRGRRNVGRQGRCCSPCPEGEGAFSSKSAMKVPHQCGLRRCPQPRRTPVLICRFSMIT